jgi:ribonuclease VapC
MIVDTSALMALLLDEPEAELFNLLMASANDLGISAGNFLELTITATRRPKPFAIATIDRLIEQFRITIEPVTIEQAHLARQAYLTYGRGNHPAALNFGDCFAYALSKATGKPLLFKGDDFGRTDVGVAG